MFSSEEFARVKIGVSNEKMSFFENTADFVLSHFSAEEQEILGKTIFPIVAEKIKIWTEQ